MLFKPNEPRTMFTDREIAKYTYETGWARARVVRSLDWDTIWVREVVIPTLKAGIALTHRVREGLSDIGIHAHEVRKLERLAVKAAK